MTKQAKIVAMTCTHAALKRREFLQLGLKYDNLLMEESAQILEIETFIPMLLQVSNTLSYPCCYRLVTPCHCKFCECVHCTGHHLLVQEGAQILNRFLRYAGTCVLVQEGDRILKIATVVFVPLLTSERSHALPYVCAFACLTSLCICEIQLQEIHC